MTHYKAPVAGCSGGVANPPPGFIFAESIVSESAKVYLTNAKMPSPVFKSSIMLQDANSNNPLSPPVPLICANVPAGETCIVKPTGFYLQPFYSNINLKQKPPVDANCDIKISPYPTKELKNSVPAAFTYSLPNNQFIHLIYMPNLEVGCSDTLFNPPPGFIFYSKINGDTVLKKITISNVKIGKISPAVGPYNYDYRHKVIFEFEWPGNDPILKAP